MNFVVELQLDDTPVPEKFRLLEVGPTGGKLQMQAVKDMFSLSVVKFNGVVANTDAQGLSMDMFQPGEVIKVSGIPAGATGASAADEAGAEVQYKALTRRAGRVHAIMPGNALSVDNCVGSCTLLDAAGRILTNEHVTELNEGEILMVVLPELALRYQGEIVKSDAGPDLALIQPSVPMTIAGMTPLQFDCASLPGTPVIIASFPKVVEEELAAAGALNPKPTISSGRVLFASVSERIADYTAFPNSSGAGVFHAGSLSLAGIHTGQISPHQDIDISRMGRPFLQALNEQLLLKSESPVFVTAETVEGFVTGIGAELVVVRKRGADQAKAAKRRRKESTRGCLARLALSVPVMSAFYTFMGF